YGVVIRVVYGVVPGRVLVDPVDEVVGGCFGAVVLSGFDFDGFLAVLLRCHLIPLLELGSSGTATPTHTSHTMQTPRLPGTANLCGAVPGLLRGGRRGPRCCPG